MHHSTPLTSSTHSFLPPYRSRFIRLCYELLYAVPLTLGLWSESHTVEILLYERYKEPPTTLHSTHLAVNITSLHASQLQLYSATLRLDAQLTGVKYVMQRWKITAAVVGIGVAWSLHVAVIVAVGVVCFVNKKHGDDEDDEAEESSSRGKFVGGVESLMMERPAAAAAAAGGGGGYVGGVEEILAGMGGGGASGYRLDGEAGESEVAERKENEDDSKQTDATGARRRHKPSE